MLRLSPDSTADFRLAAKLDAIIRAEKDGAVNGSGGVTSRSNGGEEKGISPAGEVQLDFQGAKTSSPVV